MEQYSDMPMTAPELFGVMRSLAFRQAVSLGIEAPEEVIGPTGPEELEQGFRLAWADLVAEGREDYFGAPPNIDDIPTYVWRLIDVFERCFDDAMKSMAAFVLHLLADGDFHAGNDEEAPMHEMVLALARYSSMMRMVTSRVPGCGECEACRRRAREEGA